MTFKPRTSARTASIVAFLCAGACAVGQSVLASDELRRDQHVLRYELTGPEVPRARPDRQVRPFEMPPELSRRSGAYEDVINLRGIVIGTDRESPDAMRREAVREAALDAGIAAGFDWRYARIRGLLDEHDNWLSTIFNFAPLLIDGMVMPPVIDEVTNLRQRLDDRTATSASIQFVFAADARIVTEPPDWRDFLLKEIASAPPIPEVALPKNREENQIWRRFADEGWVIGVKHADELFDAQLNLLTKTYVGMLNFRRLQSEGIVTMPQLATADRGIVIDRQGRRLSVNDRVYRLTVDSDFEDYPYWEVIPRDKR